MSQLLDRTAHLTTDCIDGYLLTAPHLTRLDGYADGIKVVLRRDWNRESTDKVALLSGGGDGHAPAHVGYVGAGMLTGAICGEIFASPSVAAVVAAIKAVTRSNRHKHSSETSTVPSPGCLLIIKSYTGDRLNFGIAVEQCRSEGIPVEMLVVGDDVTLPRSKGITGRRGLAGTVLVHKIIGAAAAQGMNLTQLVQLGQHVVNSLVSIGVATASCHIPGRQSEQRISTGELELGLGIHNEPGLEKQPVRSNAELMQQLLAMLTSAEPSRDYWFRATEQETPRTPGQTTQVVVLINNLGSAIAHELYSAAANVHKALTAEPYKYTVARTYVGSFMTALDMRGLSVTLLRVPLQDSAFWLSCLDAAVHATGWPTATANSITTAPAITPVAPSSSSAMTDVALYTSPLATPDSYLSRLLHSVANTLIAEEAALNALDAAVADGDCGSTLRIFGEGILALINSSHLSAAPVTVCHQLAHVAAKMGGTSGAIYQMLFSVSGGGHVLCILVLCNCSICPLPG